MKVLCLGIAALCYFHSVLSETTGDEDVGEGRVTKQITLLRRQTDTASPTGSNPTINFLTISDLKTCEPTNVQWFYNNGPPDASVLLAVSNAGLDQDIATRTFISPTLTGLPEARALPSRIINRNVTLSIAEDLYYTWPDVDVPPGRYRFRASFPGVSDSVFLSQPFSVLSGSDLSCLDDNTSPSQTQSSTPTPSPTSSTPTSSSSSAPGTSEPATAPTRSTGVNKGAVAGGVIGGLAVLAAAIALFFFLRHQSASHPRVKPASSGGAVSKWKNLGSFDSTKGSAAAIAASSTKKSRAYNSHGGSDSRRHRHGSTAESLGAILNTVSYREKETAEDDSKSPFDGGNKSDLGHGSDEMGMVPLSTSPHSGSNARQSLNYNRPRSQSNKLEHNGSDVTLSSTGGHYSPYSRRTSSPAIPSGRSSKDLISGPSLASAAAPAAPATRRTPRKPVPSYNPQDSTLSPPVLPELDGPSLGHKGSQGSFQFHQQEMHYLTPDPLPPQRP